MDALSLSACPTCGAIPAAPCTTPSGNRCARYHAARARHADTLAALTTGAMIGAVVTDPAMRARIRKALVAIVADDHPAAAAS